MVEKNKKLCAASRRVFIRGIGRPISLTLEATDSIDSVKALIQKHTGIPAEEHLLEVGGKPLESLGIDTVGEFGRIEVSRKLRGGVHGFVNQSKER